MIEFAPLLTLEVTHAYYGGTCTDFEYTIPSGTARLLAGGRLIVRMREGRLHVLYEKDAVRIDGRTLQFGLRLRNAYFANFTVLPFPPGEGLALYRNAADPGRLDAPVALLLDPANEEDAELLRQGLFGVVEIEVASDFYLAPRAFEIVFAAREETLRYYVVARSYTQAEFNRLEVTDAGFAAEPRPRIQFDRLGASGFGADELPAELLGGADARIALFRSRAPVARREKARKRIQLARNSTAIIENLPQPGAAAATADLIIHLSK